MFILFVVFSIILEAIYFYIGYKSIKRIDGVFKNIFLLLGMQASTFLSSLLYLNIYRYIAYIFICCLVLYVSCGKDFKAHDIFMISIFMFEKFIFEYFYFFVFLNGNVKNNNIFICLFSLAAIQAILIKPHISLYGFIKSKWNSKYKFYYRYGLLILFNALILFTIHNIMKIKGAL